MSGKTSRAALAVTAAEEEMLWNLARSRTAPVREAERAKILLAYAENRSITEVMRRVGVGRSTVYKCIDKALVSVAAGLKAIPIIVCMLQRPSGARRAGAVEVSPAGTKPKNPGSGGGRSGRFRRWRNLVFLSHAEQAGHVAPRSASRRQEHRSGGFSTSGGSRRTRSATAQRHRPGFRSEDARGSDGLSGCACTEGAVMMRVQTGSSP